MAGRKQKRPAVDPGALAREKRRLAISELYLKGELSQSKIAEALTAAGIKCSQKTVSRDLVELREEWANRRTQAWDAHVAELLRKWDHSYQRAWEDHDTCMAAFNPPKKQPHVVGDPALAQAAASHHRLAQNAMIEQGDLLGLYLPKPKTMKKEEAERRLAGIMGTTPSALPE